MRYKFLIIDQDDILHKIVLSEKKNSQDFKTNAEVLSELGQEMSRKKIVWWLVKSIVIDEERI